MGELPLYEDKLSYSLSKKVALYSTIIGYQKTKITDIKTGNINRYYIVTETIMVV